MMVLIWEGAIEQVASRKIFVKNCDFLQVATVPFLRAGDKKNHRETGSQPMQEGELLLSNKKIRFWTIAAHFAQYDNAKNISILA